LANGEQNFVTNLKRKSAEAGAIRAPVTTSGLLGDDVGGDGIDAHEGLARDFGIWSGDPEVFLNPDGEFQRINLIARPGFGGEERSIITDIFWRHLQHEILDHHALDTGFEVSFRHGPG